MERICRYICLLCVCFMALQMQANRRKVMECPGFVLSNTAEIEFKRIIQTSEQTQVDAVMYGKPGTPVVISSKAALKWADGGMACRWRKRSINIQLPARTLRKKQ